MYRPRIIPTLLLNGKGLIKTLKFKKPTYIGDPINAVKIFNDFEADELVFLDIYATKENRLIDLKLIQKIADEAFMPFSVGGGIKSLSDAKSIFNSGAEKVVINSSAIIFPELLKEIADLYGNQSLVVSIDLKKKIFGGYGIYINNGKTKVSQDIFEFIEKVTEYGAGELFVNFVDFDGTYLGFDIDMIKKINEKSKIPVIACGGASSIFDMVKLYYNTGVSGIGAGSIFVYHGIKKGVLINYPTRKELNYYFREIYE